MSSEQDLIGTWKLVSFGLFPVDGPSVSEALYLPLGESPLGRIIFTADGYMSCLLTRSDVSGSTPLTSWMQASGDEIAKIARPMVTYCGPYRLLQKDGDDILSTSVEVALDPTWIGNPQLRKWAITGTGQTRRLTLEPVQKFTLPNGVQTAGKLMWESFHSKV